MSDCYNHLCTQASTKQMHAKKIHTCIHDVHDTGIHSVTDVYTHSHIQTHCMHIYRAITYVHTYILEMGDIENFVYEKEYHDYCFLSVLLRPDYKHVKLVLSVYKNATISDDYHDIGRLLLLTIILDSKNWMISIIVKENIRLIAHP